MIKRVLAIDFGASSGRAIVGSFDGEKITQKAVCYFVEYNGNPVVCVKYYDDYKA